MQIDIEQLKVLAAHSRRIGNEGKALDLAIDYATHLHTVLVRRTALLKEASGWLHPHDHNPKELSMRIEEELKEK